MRIHDDRSTGQKIWDGCVAVFATLLVLSLAVGAAIVLIWQDVPTWAAVLGAFMALIAAALGLIWLFPATGWRVWRLLGEGLHSVRFD